MTATEDFVFAVAEIAKGRVPENFYEIRERLNYYLDRNPEKSDRMLSAVITEASLAVIQLEGNARTPLYKSLQKRGRERLERLQDFAYDQAA